MTISSTVLEFFASQSLEVTQVLMDLDRWANREVLIPLVPNGKSLTTLMPDQCYGFEVSIDERKRPEILAEIEGRTKTAAAPFRVFTSYSNLDKLSAGEVKNSLERFRADLHLSVFLAHEDREVIDEWRRRLRKELSECDAFVRQLTKKFRRSLWTDQEAELARTTATTYGAASP